MSAQTTIHNTMPTMLESILLASSTGVTVAPLNIDQIDSCIQEYELAQRASDFADTQLKNAKAALIALVQQHGTVPAHAEQSKRITGRRNQATITTATTLEIDEDAVGNLAEYLFNQRIPSLFDKLFATNTKHTLLKGAKAVLSGVQVRANEHTQITAWLGSAHGPNKRRTAIRTKGEANRIWWALSHMQPRAIGATP